MGGNMFELHRHERNKFLGKFGVARLGRLKAGLGRSKIMHIRDKGTKLGEARTCLDRTTRERIAVLAELLKSPQSSPNSHRLGGQSLCAGQNLVRFSLSIYLSICLI